MYNDIAKIYDELFPITESQKEFFIQLAKDIAPPRNLLDVGCATGELAVALDDHYNYIAAIDLNQSLLEVAAKKPHSNHLDFRRMDMTRIANVYFNRSFSAISCLGNTLAHLRDALDIQLFLSGCHKLLRAKGTLVLQILNYDKILDNETTTLSPIKSENYLFEREYDIRNDQNIVFRTIVTDKKSQKQDISDTNLVPLRPKALEGLLKDSEFENITLYEDLSKTPFTANSTVLVVQATAG